ncbi:neprilysin-1-like isoform X2 [Ornithodoros turicata]|uniref:neprilysin-1-like isoform X2 n=1 Tax=Ornithodoros turicata TaxID=34597 RepID=UPI00313A36B5
MTSDGEGLKSILRTRGANADGERTSADHYSSSAMNRLQDLNPSESTSKFKRNQSIKHAVIFMLCVVGLLLIFLAMMTPRKTLLTRSSPCETDSCQRYLQWLRDSRNLSADPCQDFYEYVCGLWQPRSSIARSVLQDSREDLKAAIVKQALLTKASQGSQIPQQKAVNFFESCDITPAGDAETFGSFLKELKLPWPATHPDVNALDILMELSVRWNFPVLFNVFVRTDATRSVVFQTSFLEFDAHNADPWTTLRKVEFLTPPNKDVIAKLAAILSKKTPDEGFSERMEQIQRRVSLVLLNATQTKRSEGEKYTSVTQFSNTNTPKIERTTWVKMVNKGLDIKLSITHFDPVLVDRKGYMRAIGELLDSTPNDDLLLYTGLVVVMCLGRFVNKDIGSLLYGHDQQRQQEEDCFVITEGFMTYAWTYPEIERLLEGQREQKAKEIATNVRQSLSDSLKSAFWMDSITEHEALRKLQSIYVSWKSTPKDDWVTAYMDLPMMGSSFLYNLANISQAVRTRVSDNADDYRPLGSEVAAQYRPHIVRISPLLLTKDLFPDAAYDSIYYGGLGSEMTRQMLAAYDVFGREFDSRGIERDWWTPHSRKLHDNITQCLAGSLEKKGSSAALTQEQMAAAYVDAAQLKPLLGALVMSPGYPDWSTGFEHYTAPQLFFLSFCFASCGDGHCNAILSQSPAFTEAFSCSSGSAMRPLQRCDIW